MGNTVAFAALLETLQHTGWVRGSMTALAGRDKLVFILMAGNTKNGFMLGIAAGKHFEWTLMAGGTHLVRRIRCHEYSGRHMGLVAFFALGGSHISAVRLMALGTKWNLAMNIMTEAAGQIGMLALDLFQLNDLVGMAGHTFISDIVCKLDDFWGMRIGMAPQTVVKFVVRLV
jgi:hypothetical protein